MTRVLAALLFASALGCDDPVHDGQVSALGPEEGSPGPLHRAGQPCLACHGGSGPGDGHFSFGGTVYKLDTTDGFEGADVLFTDAAGAKRHVVTNRAGNFYIRAEEWEPVAPIHVEVAFKDVTAVMGTHIGRDGSCATCHVDPKGPASAGRIFLSEPEADTPDGGK
jgi:hypothetical protein